MIAEIEGTLKKIPESFYLVVPMSSAQRQGARASYIGRAYGTREDALEGRLGDELVIEVRHYGPQTGAPHDDK